MGSLLFRFQRAGSSTVAPLRRAASCRRAPRRSLRRSAARRLRARARSTRAGAVSTPSASGCAGREFGQRWPSPSARPKLKLREDGLVAVSTRSPRPDSPISVSARAPSACAEPRQLGEAAREQRGARAFAQPQAVDDAAGDGIDVLRRAAERDADQIVARIGPERRVRRASPEGAARSSMPRRDGDGGRQAARHIAREGRAGQDRGLALRRDLGQHFGEQLAASSSRCPWRRAPAACRRAISGARPASVARRCWAGTTTSSASRARGLGQVAGRRDGVAAARRRAGTCVLAGRRGSDSTTSASRAHRVTLRPAWAAAQARAVPQAPAPITPICLISF